MTTKQKKQTTKKQTAAKAPKASTRSARAKDAAGGTKITSEAHAKATAALLADLEKDAAKQEAKAAAATGKPSRKPKASEAKPPKAEKPKRTSLLDAAATILREAKAPLGAKAIVEQVTERNLWAPTKGGKTPHATLYAAMTREILKKGAASRFAKAERGLFTAAASAGKGA